MEKIKSLLGAALLIGLWGFLSISTTLGNNNFNVGPQDIDDFVDHILCEYDVDVTETQLDTTLNNLIDNPISGCHPPDAQFLGNTATTADFNWPQVPNATHYTVASFGLSNGAYFEDITNQNQYKFTGLTAQEYLFIFISNCPGGPSVAGIIVIDMDVYAPDLVGGNVSKCACRNTPLNIPPDSNCNNDDVYSFPWVNNCQVNKYKFTVTDGANYHETFWILNNIGYGTTGISLPYCNDGDITDDFGSAGFAVEDPGNFEVDFNISATHIYIDNPNLSASAVRCDCYNGIPLPKKGQANLIAFTNEIKVAPNPFTELLTFEADIVQDGQAQLSLIAMDGTRHALQKLELDSGHHQLNLNMAHLPKGVYTLVLEQNGQQTFERVVKL